MSPAVAPPTVRTCRLPLVSSLLLSTCRRLESPIRSAESLPSFGSLSAGGDCLVQFSRGVSGVVGVTVCVTADVEVCRVRVVATVCGVWVVATVCGVWVVTNGLWSVGCGNGLWSVGRPRGTCLCSAGCGRGDDAGSVGGRQKSCLGLAVQLFRVCLWFWWRQSVGSGLGRRKVLASNLLHPLCRYPVLKRLDFSQGLLM